MALVPRDLVGRNRRRQHRLAAQPDPRPVRSKLLAPHPAAIQRQRRPTRSTLR
jgi:hypothetical protein